MIITRYESDSDFENCIRRPLIRLVNFLPLLLISLCLIRPSASPKPYSEPANPYNLALRIPNDLP